MAGTPDLTDNDDAQTIDPRVLIKQLAPDQLGVFEPLSGLMLLNIDQASFVEASGRFAANKCTPDDIEMARTINHEAYHFAQAAGSGYVFHRLIRSFAALNSTEPELEPAVDPETQKFLEDAKTAAGDDPELKARYERMAAMVSGQNQFAMFDQRAGDGDNSIMGALMPGFFKHLKEISEQERTQNRDGLSITGILEGSAVAHANMLMHPGKDVVPYIESDLSKLPPVYSELYGFAKANVGARSPELLLPAVALALRYAKPHNAIGQLLAILNESPAGEALAHGRDISTQLPNIDNAGPVLGTAVELRKMDDAYRLYDPVLKSLEAGEWGVDSYAFLADPQAMNAVGGFPMGLVTSDGYMGSGGIDRMEVIARMAIMSVVLRVLSRRRAEREFRQFQLDWARDVIGRLIDNVSPSAQS